ncbi:hypothetical protein [Staphylococcus simulans]|uniref:hypothetical protein n=1 Tax=Staphylococcus simulans TaxID=1286 RepID=UPI000CD2EA88|nr:hypothetical protein [Staphylococcus simulans]PNZ41443.1 hypothetical protein CD112_12045 [Staphylococcus simulans]SQE73093.1 Uncharacterised protein [Staphylococcus simulans]VED59192.1 Uncharacterised protein [Staphylococcus simulans]
MTVIKQIKEDIEKLFEAESGYKISKASGVPYQTVQDLRNKKTKLEDAKFKTIIKLYDYVSNKQSEA